jgi:hypothetical protein
VIEVYYFQASGFQYFSMRILMPSQLFFF